MGIFNTLESEKITTKRLKEMGYNYKPHFGGLYYMLHGIGGSYASVKMHYRDTEDQYGEELAYCVSDNGSQYHIKKIVNPTMDDIIVVTTLVKQSK